MKITGRPKTSIYTHVRNIPLSAKKMRAVRKASGLHIRSYAIARKGKSARPFKRFEKWTPDTVLLVAHLIFDGEIRNGGIYNNRSEALIKRVERCMRSLYDFEPTRYKNELTGVSRISYYNVELALFLKQKANELIKNIKKMSIRLKREFLRAFFDDEGCMDYRPQSNRRQIRGYQKDVGILKLARALLADLDIDSRVVKPNEIVVAGKENLIRFGHEINFSPGVYINGNRSNSRWKNHIEKRELLKRAIESFKN
ncbi:LAGLIDADG family homing endonuclease [Candidatus Kaiserbacteria bacterium]|nr:LAGLIDADG family homing endonuclease [Candidatus Kaiserbacteria bacterium]